MAELDLDKLQRSIKACAHHPNHDCNSCEYCGDNFWCFNDEMLSDFDKVIDMLKEKRPTGKWDYGTQCSVCKGTIIPPKDRKIHINFCPWCGADMRCSYDE